MTIGRNAPCPCGSGKKYKKCCLAKREETTAVELHYRRLSKAHDTLVDRLMALGHDAFGEEAILAATDEFWDWPESDEDLEPTPERMERTASLFWPWFVFSWYYEAIDEEFSFPMDQTVAEVYVEQQGDTLDSLEEKIITAFGRKPYRFYEVTGVNLGKSIDLKDVLTGHEITVQERLGSEHLQPADIVFGLAVTVDGVGMIVGLGSTIIPPRFKPQLIDMRNRLQEGQQPLTDEDLVDWEIEIRCFYLDLVESLHTPPQMTNTDGDPIEFHMLVYQIDSAENAFEKLASLCVSESKKSLRAAATLDSKGQIKVVEIPWSRKGFKGQPGLKSTSLGHIRIANKKMTIEVNSANRAETIRQLVDECMGSSARFKLDEIQDMDAMMAEPRSSRLGSEAGTTQDDLMKLPEVQAQVAEMIQRHWEGWVDEKIPALGGKTPRNAIKTADGREAVEALLADGERSHAGPAGDDPVVEFNRQGIRRVREILGL